MKKVDLIVATGGAPMVKAAYSSGKPAYGVGPGNSCQIVAEDADVSDAAEKIKTSKIFDYATSCSSENSIVIHKSVYDKMIAAFKERGGYLCSAEEKGRLKDQMWKPNKHGAMIINAEIVAKSALVIAAGANITVPENTSMLIVEGDMPLESDLFAQEKLSPVLTIYKYDTFAEGVEILTRLTDNYGTGHSCGIHTFNREYIEYLGQHMRTSRIMVRQPQAAGNGGTFFNGMPSTVTLGCGTWGNNITSENISIKHFINITWLSEPIPLNRPTDDAVWGDYFAKYGK
jgi:sulfoacetaldehyde dehydrogenase